MGIFDYFLWPLVASIGKKICNKNVKKYLKKFIGFVRRRLHSIPSLSKSKGICLPVKTCYCRKIFGVV